MSFPRYPKYKDSGVEWLGEVPEHWCVRRMKHVTHICMGQSPPSEQCNSDGIGVPFLQGCAEFGPDHPTAEKYCDAPSKVTEAGDLLFSVRAPVGRLNVADQMYGIGRGLCSIRPRDGCVARFLFYWLQEATRSLEAVATGSTYEAVSVDQVAGTVALVPDIQEQTAIAAFLDRETAKIDALITEQQRFIELLQEKRQAVISHAVTKGLNPDAPMKDSGIEWLGQVPEHWDLGALKQFWGTTDCKHITADFVDEGFPLASIREVQSRWIDLSNAKQTTDHFYRQLIEGGRQPLEGDLIFSRNATVGEVAQVPSDPPAFAMGQDVCLLRRHRPEFSADYLHAVLRSRVVVEQIEQLMIGSTFKRINVEQIRGLLVPMPPSDEQDAIATAISAAANDADRLVTNANTAITLLQERRSALISAAVTGQIDVRGFSTGGSEAA